MRFLFGKVTPRGVEHGMLGRFGPVVGGLLSLVFSPFILLFRLFPLLFRVLGTFWGKREFKYLLYGLPTILVGAVAVYFVINGKFSGGAAQRGLMYKAAAEKALAKSDWNTAKLFYQRAVEMGVNDPATRFELAQAAEKEGDTAVKVSVMHSLAPEDQPGFAPAHLWRAAVLLSSRGEADNFQRAETHLRHVIVQNPNDLTANKLLGELYFQAERLELAKDHLSRIADRSPPHRLMLAKAHGLTGDRNRAAFWAGKANEFYQQQLLADDTNVAARLALADASFFQEDFQAAADVLLAGLKLDSQQPALRSGLARVYVHLSDRVTGSSQAANQRKFELLSAALLADPNEMQVFDRLTGHLSTDQQMAQAGEDMLLENIAQGRAVAMSHLVLGTVATDIDSERAAFHLERAYEEVPTAGVIINNLAWALAHAAKPDLDRALQLMDALIQRAGENPDPRYLDTRGVILLKLGRTRDAIRDLEAGLPSHRNNSATHQALADAYQQLGLTELAERHGRIASGLAGSQER